MSRNQSPFDGYIESIIFLKMIQPASILIFLITTYSKVALSKVMWEVCMIGINLLQISFNKGVHFGWSAPALKFEFWLFFPVIQITSLSNWYKFLTSSLESPPPLALSSHLLHILVAQSDWWLSYLIHQPTFLSRKPCHLPSLLDWHRIPWLLARHLLLFFRKTSSIQGS